MLNWLTELRSHFIYLFCLFVVCFCLEALVKGLALAGQVVPATQTTSKHCRCGNLTVFVGCVVSASVYSVVSLLAQVQLFLFLETGYSFGAKCFHCFG